MSLVPTQVQATLTEGFDETFIEDSITVAAGAVLVVQVGSILSSAVGFIHKVTAGGLNAFALTPLVRKPTSDEDWRQMFFAGPFPAGGTILVRMEAISAGAPLTTPIRLLQLTEYPVCRPVAAISDGYAGLGTGADEVVTGTLSAPYPNCGILAGAWNQSGSFTDYSAGTTFSLDHTGNDAVAHKDVPAAGDYLVTWKRNAAGTGDGCSMAVMLCADSAVLAGKSAPSVAWPLTASTDNRTLKDAGGNPFLVLGRTLWELLKLSPVERIDVLNDWVRRGGNTILMQMPSAFATYISTGSAANYNGDQPFDDTIGGSPWPGNFDWVSPTDAPDVTTPNTAWWADVQSLFTYCEDHNIAVMHDATFLGTDAGTGHWFNEFIANGPTRMGVFGAFVADLLKDFGNNLAVFGGDTNLTVAGVAELQAYIAGYKGVSGQASALYGFHFNHPTTSQSNATLAADANLNLFYDRDELTPAATARTAWGEDAGPAFLEETCYEGGGIVSTYELRKYQWSTYFNSIAGHVSGNEELISCRRDFFLYLDTVGSRHQKIFNEFVRSLAWSGLVPNGLSGIGTLIVDPGARDTDTGVEACANAAGTLLVAYKPHASPGFSVYGTKMSAPFTGYWLNPTTGVLTYIDTFTPTGVKAFLDPGDNGTGKNDWVLLLTAAPLDQAAFRFFNDDGSESASTAAAAQGTSISLAAGNAKRLRFLVNASGDPDAASFNLQYRKVGDSTWRDVH